MSEREPAPNNSNFQSLEDMGISTEQRIAMEKGITIFEQNGIISGEVADQMREALITQDPHIRAREVQQFYTRRRFLLIGGGFLAGVGATAIAGKFLLPPSKEVPTPPSSNTTDSQIVIPPTPTKAPTVTPTPYLTKEQTEMLKEVLTTHESSMSLKHWTISYDTYNPAISYALDGPINRVKSGDEIRIHRPFFFDMPTGVVMLKEDTIPPGYLKMRVLGLREIEDWLIYDTRNVTNSNQKALDSDKRAVVFREYDQNDPNKPPQVHYVEITPANGLPDEFLIKYLKRVGEP